MVRIIARPVTLSVRLVANISAGHIVLTLISGYSSFFLCSSFIKFFIILPTQVGYIIFELGVCLIQAYIFCLLLSLYREDHRNY